MVKDELAIEIDSMIRSHVGEVDSPQLREKMLKEICNLRFKYMGEVSPQEFFEILAEVAEYKDN